MNLNVNDWKEFKTSKLFYDMQNGKKQINKCLKMEMNVFM